MIDHQNRIPNPALQPLDEIGAKIAEANVMAYLELKAHQEKVWAFKGTSFHSVKEA